MLENLSDKQLREWYDKCQIAKAVENHLTAQNDHGKQSRLMHDCWSIYDYGDMVKVVYFKSLPSLKDPRKDPLFPELSDLKERPKTTRQKKPDEERFANSISRTRGRIFELAMCNEFTHFCTFTQDKEKRNRFDLAAFRKDFAQLVRNLNRDRPDDGKIKYLLIPEHHKDGAWHMHGLLMGLTDDDLRPFSLSEKLPERIRKQIAAGEKVFDWTRYRKAFGYFTCTEIKQGTACAKYITKYISKDLQSSLLESGAHLYFASQGLKGKEAIIKQSFDKCPVTEWDFENQYIKVKEITVR